METADVMTPLETVYCCRGCRKPLFLSSQVSQEHLDERGAERRFGGKTNSQPVAACTSHFLRDLPAWLKPLLEDGRVSGKLVCECGSKFGSFDWTGSQCSCGAWVTPSIQVPKSKVDGKPRA